MHPPLLQPGTTQCTWGHGGGGRELASSLRGHQHSVFRPVAGHGLDSVLRNKINAPINFYFHPFFDLQFPVGSEDPCEVFPTDIFLSAIPAWILSLCQHQGSHEGPFRHLWTIYFPSSLLNSSENNKKWKLKKFCAIIPSISDLLLHELEAKLVKNFWFYAIFHIQLYH